ncbi:unnamed protein product [Strongylus vulgaris]|uniref:Uncharacterized protein n=1 Tax=Strongylus vulgaris TaxID=40348 RepID=A0A3P7JFM4_STRVU|nr:unnamed protein product [Strongylus vulgaris]
MQEITRIFQGAANLGLYQEKILKEAMVPWKQKHPNFIFQQDCVPAYGAKTTIHFLETHFLTKDLWPVNSPDLNPLDFSSKCKKSGNFAKRIDQGNNLDLNYLRRTIDLKKQINACVKADGGPFENSLLKNSGAAPTQLQQAGNEKNNKPVILQVFPIVDAIV